MRIAQLLDAEQKLVLTALQFQAISPFQQRPEILRPSSTSRSICGSSFKVMAWQDA